MNCAAFRPTFLVLLVLGSAAACGDDGGEDGRGDDDGSAGAEAGSGGRAGSDSGGDAGGASGMGGSGRSGEGGASGARAGRGGEGGGGSGEAGAGGGDPGAAFVLEQISVGSDVSCGVRADGTLWCWGRNTSGHALGEPAAEVVGATQLGTDDDWAYVAAAALFRCALKNDGAVLCWGSGGPGGELGRPWNAANDDSYPPQAIAAAGPWASLSTHTDRACAIAVDGALYCWGGMPPDPDGTPEQVGSETDWEQVSVGAEHGCGLKQSGALYCWGSNEYGQLGQGGLTPSESSSTEPFDGIASSVDPLRVGSDTDWTTVASGREHSCARKDNGAIYCWGNNDEGELGTGDVQLRSMPAAVLSARAYAQLFAGGTTSCAITTSDELLCWGKLHDETAFGGMARSNLPAPVSGGHDWKSVDLDDALHACGLTTDGSAYCWGANHEGMLGDATSDDRPGLTPPTPPG